MKQQIRNKLAWYRNPLGGWSVDYDEFIQTDLKTPQSKLQ